jgi:hypothetical protein
VKRAESGTGRTPQVGLPRCLADAIWLQSYKCREICTGGGAGEQRIRKVFGSDIAGADSFRSLGDSKIVKRGQGWDPKRDCC